MWRPIITAAYGQQGGPPGGAGMPNMGDFGQAPNETDATGGPTIDEVD